MTNDQIAIRLNQLQAAVNDLMTITARQVSNTALSRIIRETELRIDSMEVRLTEIESRLAALEEEE